MGEGKGRIDRDRDRDDSVDDSDRAWAENIGSLFLVIRYIWDIYTVYREYILCIWDVRREGGSSSAAAVASLPPAIWQPCRDCCPPSRVPFIMRGPGATLT